MTRSHLHSFNLPVPEIHFVLGSGLASALDSIHDTGEWKFAGEIKFSELPGLSSASAPGHRGAYKYFRNSANDKSIVFQIGRLHGYEGLSARQVIQTVMISRLAGTCKFVLTNAAGGLDKSFKVGSVMLIKDHVNLTGDNPLVGPNPVDHDGKYMGSRFPDMSVVYDNKLREHLRTAMAGVKLEVNEGTYLGLLGPSFETPAEIALFSQWGLHAVGMSTVWEAIALRHSGAKVAGISLISNVGCGLTDSEPLCHEDIMIQSQRSSKMMIEGLFKFAEVELDVKSVRS
jgi:purine-nucleoside phosphorylase